MSAQPHESTTGAYRLANLRWSGVPVVVTRGSLSRSNRMAEHERSGAATPDGPGSSPGTKRVHAPNDTTMAVIEPIIYATYGKSNFAHNLAKHVAEKVDAWPNSSPGFGGETREEMVLHTCWHWFSGGDTAASVARKIEEAL